MKQPKIDIQRELDACASDIPEVVIIPNTKKKIKLKWIKRGTNRKISNLLNSSDKSNKYEDTLLAKQAALIVLNGYFRIALFYPFLWRWYYYVKQYNDYQLYTIIDIGKKKVQQMPYLMAMTYLHGLNDVLMAMTRDEVNPSNRGSSSVIKE
jgi:hypothetical protein